MERFWGNGSLERDLGPNRLTAGQVVSAGPELPEAAYWNVTVV